jgi:hypothetical protein
MTTSSQRRLSRALNQILCAFLLFAQQAALTHAVGHALAEQSTQQRAADAYEREHAPAPKLADLCAYDAAFGQVLGGIAATPASVVPVVAVCRTVLHRSRACTAADVLTPRSRGPPVLL